MPTLPVKKGVVRLRKRHDTHFVLLMIPLGLVSFALQPASNVTPPIANGLIVIAILLSLLILESYFHHFELDARGISDISWFRRVETELLWADAESYSERGAEMTLQAGPKEIAFTRRTRNWAALDHLIRHHTGLNPTFRNCWGGRGMPVHRPRSIFDNNIPLGIFLTIWGLLWGLIWALAPHGPERPAWGPPLACLIGLVVFLAGLRLATGWIRTTHQGIERLRLGVVRERIAWESIDSIGLDGSFKNGHRLVIWSGTRYIAMSATWGRCGELMQELGHCAGPDARIFASPRS